MIDKFLNKIPTHVKGFIALGLGAVILVVTLGREDLVNVVLIIAAIVLFFYGIEKTGLLSKCCNMLKGKK